MSKILIDEAVVRQALEALEVVARQPVGKGTVDAIAALRKALAEQSAPTSKPWVGLTHQERNAIRGKYWIAMSDAVFDDIEAKLKERNT